jgi:hypothetical protein
MSTFNFTDQEKEVLLRELNIRYLDPELEAIHQRFQDMGLIACIDMPSGARRCVINDLGHQAILAVTEGTI